MCGYSFQNSDLLIIIADILIPPPNSLPELKTRGSSKIRIERFLVDGYTRWLFEKINPLAAEAGTIRRTGVKSTSCTLFWSLDRGESLIKYNFNQTMTV